MHLRYALRRHFGALTGHKLPLVVHMSASKRSVPFAKFSRKKALNAATGLNLAVINRGTDELGFMAVSCTTVAGGSAEHAQFQRAGGHSWRCLQLQMGSLLADAGCL